MLDVEPLEKLEAPVPATPVLVTLPEAVAPFPNWYGAVRKMLSVSLVPSQSPTKLPYTVQSVASKVLL
jgi:hypothetical protein